MLCCENPLLSAAWSECGKRSLIPSVKRFCPDVVCLPLFRLIINSWNRKSERRRKKNLLFFPLEFIIQCPGHICIVSYCSDKRRDLKFCFRFYVILFIIRKKIITTVFMHLLSFLYSLIAIQYLIPKPLALDEKFQLAKCFKFRFLSWFRLSSHLHENK